MSATVPPSYLPTFLARYRVGGVVAVDALVDAGPEAAPQRRRFLPGHLPCGECPRCRRALPGACAHPRQPLAALVAGAATPRVEVPNRFLVPIDEPLDAAPLSDERAALAGVAALAGTALAVAAFAPGDVAIWLGGGPVVTAGRALSVAAGGHAFALAEAEGAAGLRDEITGALAGSGLSHGAHKRVLILTDPAPPVWAAALAVADPGSVFVALGEGAGTLPALTLPADARLICASAYHPDLLVEALAALRRGTLDGLTGRVGARTEDPGTEVLLVPLAPAAV